MIAVPKITQFICPTLSLSRYQRTLATYKENSILSKQDLSLYKVWYALILMNKRVTISVVKNPDTPSNNPRAASVSKDRQQDVRRVLVQVAAELTFMLLHQYPPELRGLFTTRWIPANPVELLNYHGQELLYISGREHLPDGAESEVKAPAEEDQTDVKEMKKTEANEEVIFKEVFSKLEGFKTRKDAPGIKALEGQWD